MALEETPVVTCFLRNRGELLLLRRSREVGSYRGRWGGVAGHAEGDPDEAARREIQEETGLGDAVRLVRKGEAFTVDDEGLGKRWVVHPYLFDCSSRDVRLDWESVDAEWIVPTEILRREVVPDLFRSYESVAPGVADIREDREHGSAYLSIRAVEVLRDRAGRLAAQERDDAPGDGDDLAALAGELLAARPTMVALANRIHRVMHATDSERRASTVERAAIAVIENAFEQEDAAVRRAAAIVAGRRVATFSRSGTVLDALLGARLRPAQVVVAESRPGSEGEGLAKRLEEAGVRAALVPDAALAAAMASAPAELAIVGADAILPSGGVVNKTGTKPFALVGRDLGIPLYVVAADDKLSPEEDVDLSERSVSEPDVPLFERTEASLLHALVLGGSVCERAEIARRVESLRALRAWRGAARGVSFRPAD